MTFRSDDDAREERVRALEKQLEEARRELSIARPKVDRLEIAEKENKRLVAELQRPAAGLPKPGSSGGGLRASLLLLGGLVLLLVSGLAMAGVFLATSSGPRGGDDWARADAERRAAEAEQRAQDLSEALARSEAEAARREAEAHAAIDPVAPSSVAPEPVPLLPEPPIDPASLVDHSIDFPAILRDGRVVSVTGDAPVARRARCRISIAAASSDCRADVFCGSESLYPRTGRGGYFHCQVSDHVLESGADSNPTSSSGDPRLELDVAHRQITISDGPSPEWSVLVAYDAG